MSEERKPIPPPLVVDLTRPPWDCVSVQHEPAPAATLDDFRALRAIALPHAVASEMNTLRDQVAAFREELTATPGAALVAFHCAAIREILASLETLFDVDPGEEPRARSFVIDASTGAPK